MQSMKNILKVTSISLLILTGCQTTSQMTNNHEQVSKKLSNEPYHSKPYQIVIAATGSKSLTDGVDGSTGLSNEKAITHDSDKSRTTNAAVSGSFVGASFLGTAASPLDGLLVFMLKNDSDPASVPKLIYLFDKPENEKETKQKSIEYGQQTRADVRNATKIIVNNLRKKHTVSHEPGIYYIKNTGQDFCYKDHGCLISEYKAFANPKKDILNPKVGPAPTYTGKKEMLYSVSNHYITKKLTPENHTIDFNSSKFNPLRDFYLPVSELLSDNAYWYLPPDYSTTGYAIMLNKGKALPWNVPATKPTLQQVNNTKMDL